MSIHHSVVRLQYLKTASQRPLLSWLHNRPYQTTYQKTSRDRSQRHVASSQTRGLLPTMCKSSLQQDTRCFDEDRPPPESPITTSSRRLSTRLQLTYQSEESPSGSGGSKQFGKWLGSQGRRRPDTLAASVVQRRLEGALDQAEEVEEVINPNLPQSLKDSQ